MIRITGSGSPQRARWRPSVQKPRRLWRARSPTPHTKKSGQIIHALGKLGPAARQAIPELVKVLQDQVLHESIGDRTEAARSLGEIGHGAGEAVPALIESLKDEDWSLRSAAAEALGNICPAARDVASALNDARNDDNQWVRKAASQALAKIQDKEGSAKTEQGSM